MKLQTIMMPETEYQHTEKVALVCSDSGVSPALATTVRKLIGLCSAMPAEPRVKCDSCLGSRRNRLNHQHFFMVFLPPLSLSN